VEFESPEGAAAAVALNHVVLSGRRLRVDYAAARGPGPVAGMRGPAPMDLSDLDA
jgi:hypothetical protein